MKFIARTFPVQNPFFRVIPSISKIQYRTVDIVGYGLSFRWGYWMYIIVVIPSKKEQNENS